MAILSTLQSRKSLPLDEKWLLVPAFLKVLAFDELESSFILFPQAFRGLCKRLAHRVTKKSQTIMSANKGAPVDANPNFYLKVMPSFFCFLNSLYSFTQDYCTEHKRGLLQIHDKITPQECRLRDMTYAAPINVDVEYTRGNQRVIKRDLTIGRMPIMLRSSKCILKDLAEEELARVQECPYDPGGYFIVKGSEKVILIQEQLSKNRIMIGRNSNKDLQCEVLSSTAEKKSKTYVIARRNRYWLRHNQLNDDIPVAIVFKAMGVESDYNIISAIGLEEKYVTAFSASLDECASNHIYTQQQAINYITSKIKVRKFGSPYGGGSTASAGIPLPKEHEAVDFLSSSMICHIPCHDGNFKMKAIFLGLMTRRLIQAELGECDLDDRDFYGNKRLELAGSLLSLLFEDVLKRFNTELKRVADNSLGKTLAAPLDIVKHMRQVCLSSLYGRVHTFRI
ncbi:DNA-directed RNA polymerase, beta subunit [Cooperia oncophora]